MRTWLDRSRCRSYDVFTTFPSSNSPKIKSSATRLGQLFNLFEVSPYVKGDWQVLMLTRLFSNCLSVLLNGCGLFLFLSIHADLFSSTVNLICWEEYMHISSLAISTVQIPMPRKNIWDCLLPKNPSKGLEMYRRDENGTCSRAIFLDNRCLAFLCLNNNPWSVSIAAEECIGELKQELKLVFPISI